MSAVSPDAIERNRALSRAAKQRRRGTCVDCGAETRYAGHPGKPMPDRCVPCSNRRIGISLRGHGPVVGRALELLADGPMTYSQLRDQIPTTSNQMGTLLHRLLRYQLIERVGRGVYQLRP